MSSLSKDKTLGVIGSVVFFFLPKPNSVTFGGCTVLEGMAGFSLSFPFPLEDASDDEGIGEDTGGGGFADRIDFLSSFATTLGSTFCFLMTDHKIELSCGVKWSTSNAFVSSHNRA
jgi:hypothetical protein